MGRGAARSTPSGGRRGKEDRVRPAQREVAPKRQAQRGGSTEAAQRKALSRRRLEAHRADATLAAVTGGRRGAPLTERVAETDLCGRRQSRSKEDGARLG